MTDSDSDRSGIAAQVLGLDVDRLAKFLESTNLPEVWWEYTHSISPPKFRKFGNDETVSP